MQHRALFSQQDARAGPFRAASGLLSVGAHTNLMEREERGRGDGEMDDMCTNA